MGGAHIVGPEFRQLVVGRQFARQAIVQPRSISGRSFVIDRRWNLRAERPESVGVGRLNLPPRFRSVTLLAAPAQSPLRERPVSRRF